MDRGDTLRPTLTQLYGIAEDVNVVRAGHDLYA